MLREVEFEHAWRDLYQKLDVQECMKWYNSPSGSSVEVKVEEEEGEGEETEEFGRKLRAIVETALGVGKDSGAVMTKAHRRTMRAKFIEEEEKSQVETEPKSERTSVKLLRKLGIVSKKKRASENSDTEDKSSVKDASTNTKVALELKDVSESLHR